MALLEVRNLAASYGQTQVLRDVSFDVSAGGITTILGANGAGKTTTLRAITGMATRRGQLRFDGVAIESLTTDEIARLGIAHVPEGRGTLSGLSVEENLRVGAYRREVKGSLKSNMDRVYGYFPRLKERRLQQSGTLSGGEQQMLALGRALMMNPKLLLLDEPSFGLAPMVTQEIFLILRSINASERVGVLLVEQNATLALDLADHAYLLETGAVVFSGKSEEIRGDDAIRKAYLGY